jgi:hypothetical protein
MGIFPERKAEGVKREMKGLICQGESAYEKRSDTLSQIKRVFRQSCQGTGRKGL